MRPRRFTGAVIACCAVLAAVLGLAAYQGAAPASAARRPAAAPGGSAAPAADGGQQIAVAAYIHPGADREAWNRLIEAPSSKVSVLVVNVLNGPDHQRNAQWADVIQRAHASGKRVIGYVPTGYLGQVDAGEKAFRTRLGSTEVADWIAQVQHDVAAWYELYGSSIDGIFFDEAHNECGFADEYAELNQFVKRHHPGALTVLNPGTAVQQCYENAADVLLTFEGAYQNYREDAADENLRYRALDWQPEDPGKIWHILYDVPADRIQEVTALARERGAGFVQITDDVMDNPYDTLPAESYWSALVDAVPGGEPAVAEPEPRGGEGPAPATPAGFGAAETDYTSTRLRWSAVADAARYNVYLDGELAATLPAPYTAVTIGGLEPEERTYRLHVTAESRTGAESEPTAAATVTTLALPDGQRIANVRVTASDETITVSADFLTPFAFQRVFLPAESAGADTPCWTIDYDQAGYVCAVYLVENGRLFVYAGEDVSGRRQWTWRQIGTAQPQVDGRYTYTWTIPRQSSGPAVQGDAVVVQGEGYAPLTNIFQPCPAGEGRCGP